MKKFIIIALLVLGLASTGFAAGYDVCSSIKQFAFAVMDARNAGVGKAAVEEVIDRGTTTPTMKEAMHATTNLAYTLPEGYSAYSFADLTFNVCIKAD